MSFIEFLLLFWQEEASQVSGPASAGFSDADAWEDITAWEV